METYSSSFHDSKIKAWNQLVQGYIRTDMLETVTPRDKYALLIDKLDQRMYIFEDGEIYVTCWSSQPVCPMSASRITKPAPVSFCW